MSNENEVLKNKFIQKLKDGGIDRVTNAAGNILLRPNDNISFMGKERFEAYKKALETVLNEHYQGTDVYTYYYTFDREKHGFSNFERWKNWFMDK